MPYSQAYLDNHTNLRKAIIDAINSVNSCTKDALTQQAKSGDKDAEKTLTLLPNLSERILDTIKSIEKNQAHGAESVGSTFRLIAAEKTYTNAPQLTAFIKLSSVLCQQLVRVNALLSLARDPNDTPAAQATIIAAVNKVCDKTVNSKAFDESSKAFHDSIGKISFSITKMHENASRLKANLDTLTSEITKKNQALQQITQGFSKQFDRLSNTLTDHNTVITTITRALKTNTAQLNLANLKDLRASLTEAQNALSKPDASLHQLNNQRRALNSALDTTLALAKRSAEGHQRELTPLQNSLPSLSTKDNSALNQLENLNRNVMETVTNEVHQLNALILEGNRLKNDERLTLTTHHLKTYGDTIRALQNTLHDELTELSNETTPALSTLISRHPQHTTAFKPLTDYIATFENTLATCADEWSYGEITWLSNHYGEINPNIITAQQRLHTTLAKHAERKAVLERNAEAISAKYDECNKTANDVDNDEALKAAQAALTAFDNSISALENRKLTDEAYQALADTTQARLAEAEKKIEAIKNTIQPLKALKKEMDLLETAINTALNNTPAEDKKNQALTQLKESLLAINNTPAAFKQNTKTVQAISKRYEKLTGNKPNFPKQLLGKIQQVEVRKPSPFAQTIIRGMLIGAAVGIGGFIASAIFLSLFVPGVNVLTAFAIGAGVSLFCLAGGAGIGTAVAFFKKKREANPTANIVLPGQNGSIHVGSPRAPTPNPTTPPHDGFLNTLNQGRWRAFSTQDSLASLAAERGDSTQVSLRHLSNHPAGSQSRSQSTEGNPRDSVVVAKSVSERGSEGERVDELESDAEESSDLSSSGSYSL